MSSEKGRLFCLALNGLITGYTSIMMSIYIVDNDAIRLTRKLSQWRKFRQNDW